jgi:hypothetical protein
VPEAIALAACPELLIYTRSPLARVTEAVIEKFKTVDPPEILPTATDKSTRARIMPPVLAG